MVSTDIAVGKLKDNHFSYDKNALVLDIWELREIGFG